MSHEGFGFRPEPGDRGHGQAGKPRAPRTFWFWAGHTAQGSIRIPTQRIPITARTMNAPTTGQLAFAA